jgi:cytochrome P450
LACRDNYGGLVAFDARTTIVNDPGLVRGVMLDRGDELTLEHDFLQRPLTQRDVEQVWELRRAVNRLLRPQALGHMADSVAATVRDVIEDVAPSTAVDPVPLMEQVTGRAIAEFYFGRDCAQIPEAVGALLDALARVIGNPFALPPNRLSPVRRRIRHHHEQLVALVQPLVDERAARPSAYDDLVSQLVLAAPDVPRDRLTHWILASLLAGHRVPAAAAAWMLMLVAERPEWQVRLEAEAAQFAQDVAQARPGPSRGYVTAMAVVLETLRLYPTTWLISRTARRDIAIAGFEFAAGHNFVLSPYVLHRDPAGWPHAYEFRAERWLHPVRPRGLFIPFGLGMHACPGRDPAILTLVATLLTVVRNWTLSCTDGPVRADPRTTLLPNSLRISFTPRGSVSARGVSPLAG